VSIRNRRALAKERWGGYRSKPCEFRHYRWWDTARALARRQIQQHSWRSKNWRNFKVAEAHITHQFEQPFYLLGKNK